MADMASLLLVRPFQGTDADYNAYASVWNRVRVGEDFTPERMKGDDSRNNPKHIQARFLAELNGEPVGLGCYFHLPWTYHPRRFHLELMVVPEARGQGIGTIIYDRLKREAKAHNPIAFRAYYRDDWKESEAFAQKHGYFEVMRGFESRLNVQDFDFEPWCEAEHKPEQHGIIFKTLAELSQTEPNWGRKLWAMENAALPDIPVPDPIMIQTYEFYETKVLNDPNCLLNAWFIAIDKKSGEWAGSSSLWKRDGTYLDTGFTGVRREYRRKGIALALKLRAVRFAKEAGVQEIRTDNASANRPMLSINEALGFVKQPAWVELALEFEPGGATARYEQAETKPAGEAV